MAWNDAGFLSVSMSERSRVADPGGFCELLGAHAAITAPDPHGVLAGEQPPDHFHRRELALPALHGGCRGTEDGHARGSFIKCI